jgi:FtsP/CotA-like multicopper oxidase with cupredoxin domain
MISLTFLSGVTRYYDFTVSRGIIAPDGYEKTSILINDQFPGPLIEANWGDMIQVTVHNNITGPEEGLALHWHGLTQKKTPWFDGVAAVQQCPITPGGTFTYNVQADLYGSSWYHSHYSAQYAGGLLGPMVIHGPKNADYDFDLGPIIVSDYYHRDYFDIIEDVVGTSPIAALAAPAGDNTLINGKMDFDCSLAAEGTTCTSNAGLSKFNFTTGKTHRLRIINTSATGLHLFSIDDHELTVIGV